MTIHEHLLEACKRPAQEDKPFEEITINLDRHYVAVGNHVLVRNSKMTTDPAPFERFICFDGDPYREIERLYAQYKRSVPSKREALNKGPFKALSSDQLSMQELENNLPRYEARIQLESFICLGACEGIIPWYVPSYFFWQGADPDCIIYRNWITNDLKED